MSTQDESFSHNSFAVPQRLSKSAASMFARQAKFVEFVFLDPFSPLVLGNRQRLRRLPCHLSLPALPTLTCEYDDLPLQLYACHHSEV